MGYRGRPLPAYLGHGGMEKHEIGERFGALAAGSGLRLDVATREGDRLYGDDWYRFMANCRCVLGVESGVSAFDLEDEVFEEHKRRLAAGLSVGLEDLQTLPRWEDVVYYRTIGPRHFEAAALRVCQVLFEGRYSGVMEPMVHYIPLKKDFSNLDEVVRLIRDDAVCAELDRECVPRPDRLPLVQLRAFRRRRRRHAPGHRAECAANPGGRARCRARVDFWEYPAALAAARRVGGDLADPVGARSACHPFRPARDGPRPAAARPRLMGATLVVYAALDWPLRAAVDEHLHAFGRYSERPCIYLNLAVRRPPRWLKRVPVDLVVFHTTFLSKRGTPPFWTKLVDRARPLADLDAVRVALPQDEYLPPLSLCDFVRDLDVAHVFSVAPQSEWPVIYPTVDPARISHVLTGYLEPTTVARIAETAASADGRPLDIGYRAKDLPAWLGRHAKLKADIGRVFADAAPKRGLSCDISMRPEDSLAGQDWMRFLLSCRYTIGVEGGASILDRDGSIRRCCDRVLAERPGTTFEELERECFSGRDGEFGLVALSPRHLEAVAARTCQVLIEGDYDGVLQADRHYIPLKRDFSNLDDVLETIRRDDRREEIVETAYREIVASGAWSYERFVQHVERTALPDAPPPSVSRARRLAAVWGRVSDTIARAEVVLRLKAARRLRRI